MEAIKVRMVARILKLDHRWAATHNTIKGPPYQHIRRSHRLKATPQYPIEHEFDPAVQLSTTKKPIAWPIVWRPQSGERWSCPDLLARAEAKSHSTLQQTSCAQRQRYGNNFRDLQQSNPRLTPF